MRKAYSLLLAKRPTEWVAPLQQAALLRTVQANLRAQIDPSLALHCCVGHWDGQCLTLWADAAVWATKLRYLAPMLVEKVRKYKGMGELREIKVKVQMVPAKAATLTPSMVKPLPQRTVLSMQESAQVVSDPELKAALLRLLGRLRG
ncbi:MAG: DUF721 domain-containing protein [Gammaproteobacteria bacterium]|nr:DUF721 domain-containing protein [Gammaproteobacteria bacterium]